MANPDREPRTVLDSGGEHVSHFVTVANGQPVRLARPSTVTEPLIGARPQPFAAGPIPDADAREKN